MFPCTFSIYNRRVDYEELKTKPPRRNNAGKQSFAAEVHRWGGKEYLARNVQSYAYNFEYNTGELLYFARRPGDFSKAEFRWSDPPQVTFEGPDITTHHLRNAKAIAKELNFFLEDGRQKAVLLKERERYGRFLSPLEKILGS